MKARVFKNLVAILFIGIFTIKMAISIAPVFLYLDSNTVTAVIMQLEQETKTEKEGPEKDVFKEKKFFDEAYNHVIVYLAFLAETKMLHNSEHSLYKQTFHPVVPTPPPNA